MPNWSKWIFLALIFFMVFIPVFGLAQESVPTDPGQWDTFFNSIGGAKGAGVMAAVVALIQVILQLLKSPLGSLAGPYKLLLVTGMTLLLGVAGLRVEGFDWQSALIHSSTLASFQVFLNQIWKQMLEAKNKTV